MFEPVCCLFLQASDGQCHCTIGYQPSNNGSVCVNKLYDVCRDGKARTQYGDCMDRYQWLQHCREQVRPCATTWHTQMPKIKKRKGTWDLFYKSTGNSPWRCVWIMFEDFNATQNTQNYFNITVTSMSIFSRDSYYKLYVSKEAWTPHAITFVSVHYSRLWYERS